LTLDALGLGGFGYDLKALEGAADGPYRDYTVRLMRYLERWNEALTDALSLSLSLSLSLQYVLQEFANPLRIIPFYDKMDSETNRKFKGASKGLTDFLLNIIQERKTKVCCGSVCHGMADDAGSRSRPAWHDGTSRVGKTRTPICCTC